MDIPIAASWRRRLLRGALAVLVAGGIYVGYALRFGAPIGALCDTAADCSWSGLGHRVCLQTYWGYCTTPCRSTADCPAGWTCDLRNTQGSLCLRGPATKKR